MKLKDIALNNLRRRKLKMLFLILGLVFGVTTVVTLMSISAAMNSNLEDQLKGIGAKVVVKPKTDKISFSYGPVVIASGVAYDIKELTLNTIDQIKSVGKDQISVIAPKFLESVQIADKKMLVVGIDYEQELKLKPYWTVEGDYPKTEQHLLVGQKVAKTLGLEKGSPLKIRDKEFVVSGILTETASEEDGLIFMNLSALQQLVNKPNNLTFIEVSVLGGEENEVVVDHVVSNLKDALPEATITPVKEAVEARKQLGDRFGNFSLIISFIVALIGALIILSKMMSSVNERTREIGILRAIGFRKSHILKIILLEASVISLVGGVVGYLLGMITAIYIAPKVTQLELIVEWDPITMLFVIIASVIIGLASSVYPALKAAKLEPAEALRFI
jgi:putative ABC transport system permease protein